eukprot:TRINITY_DN9346_c0_g1_i1.p1 TRINITY_DN9346_c0_g1~~TRINITY_DN9346_c0_g1_i1.p1  ORF type:complete len:150 (+),score=29.18 TRINITY_DN9346_c0_g1_i1:111-560(+)
MAGTNDEVSLPKATVSKLIKDILPDGVKCSTDTRDLILECCVEFIHLLSTEANELCSKEKKTTIGPQHILKALESLGFESYVNDVNKVYEEVESMEKPKKTKKSWDSLGIPREQLLREQQELFAKARTVLELKKSQEGKSTSPETQSSS